MGLEGGSAERRAEELAEQGDAAAGAWAAGAAGERKVAVALAALPATWTVLHDRLLRPGQSGANLDHVVVGPSGLFLVDAKNRAGRVTEWDGGLFQHTVRERQPVTVSLAGELKKVHGMAAYVAARPVCRWNRSSASPVCTPSSSARPAWCGACGSCQCPAWSVG